MPLFMMISGFFSARADGSFIKFTAKKFRQLILPSLVFGVIFALSWHFVAGGGIFKAFVTCYWFLKSAFICALLYFVAMRFSSKSLGYVVTLAASIFLSIYMVNMMYPAFIIGTIISRYREQFSRCAFWTSLATGVAFVIMFAAQDADMAADSYLKIFSYFHSGGFNEFLQQFCRFSFKVVLGLMGSIFCIALFIELAKYMHASRVGRTLGQWGTLTLGIYLWQAILLEHLMMKTINLSSFTLPLFNYVISPLISLIVVLVCILLTKALKSNPWTAFLMLGAPRPVSK